MVVTGGEPGGGATPGAVGVLMGGVAVLLPGAEVLPPPGMPPVPLEPLEPPWPLESELSLALRGAGEGVQGQRRHPGRPGGVPGEAGTSVLGGVTQRPSDQAMTRSAR